MEDEPRPPAYRWPFANRPLIFEGHVMASLTTHASILILILSVSTTGWSQDLTRGGIPVGSQVELSDVIVVVPESRTSVAAFSVSNSLWANVALDSPLEENVEVVVVGELAAFQHKSTIFAFSGLTGKWARLALPDGSTARLSFGGNGYVRVLDAKSLYVFGRNAEAWSGVSLSTGKQLKIE